MTSAFRFAATLSILTVVASANAEGKTKEKWVSLFDLLSNAPVEAIEHPVDVSKVYIHADKDTLKGRRVEKIHYILD